MSEFDQITSQVKLNKSQRRFCKISMKKNVRLLAPAGSGKTFSLLWRCKYLIEESIKKNRQEPRFLIVTFTRSAKYELEDRLKNRPEFQGIKATVKTLNGWGWEQNKNTGKKLIVGRKGRKELVSNDLQKLCKEYPGLSPLVKSSQQLNRYANDIIDIIDQLKSLGFSHTMGKRNYRSHVKQLEKLGLLPVYRQLEETLWRMENLSTEKVAVQEAAVWEFFEFFKKAVVQLENNNRFTMEDQKYWARMNLEKKIKEKSFPQGGARYTHLFVDEFQDVNPLDVALLKAISLYHGRGDNISMTIVGDDDQAIFGWRGTTPEYILHPEEYLGVPFETEVLDTNYRSPKKIVELSSKLISYNRNRVPKEMKSAAKGKAYVKVVSKPKAMTTIESTLTMIHDLIDNKGCENVALIGRKQTSLFPYQILLSAEDTKYNVAADIDIFDGEAMNALQDILQAVIKAKQKYVDEPVEDILKIMHKIDRYQLSTSDVGKIRAYLDRFDYRNIYEAIDRLKDYPTRIKNMDPNDICEIITDIIDATSVYDFMDMVNSKLVGLNQDYTKIDTDNHYKKPQFFRLQDIAYRYGEDFKAFANDIKKAKRNSTNSRSRNNDSSNYGYQLNQHIKIHLVTATRAKGHEYDAVIILEADDHEWPNRLSGNMEEERRLFYVAMTRAKRYLYFSVSQEIWESRFLLEAGVI